MDREKRLQSAISTGGVSKYKGKNIARGYARWFGVDLLCAINELRMFGVAIDKEYEEKVSQSIKARSEAKRNKGKTPADSVPEWQDDTFAYIAGYTSWGFPYGVTWEELGETSQFADED